MYCAKMYTFTVTKPQEFSACLRENLAFRSQTHKTLKLTHKEPILLSYHREMEFKMALARSDKRLLKSNAETLKF